MANDVADLIDETTIFAWMDGILIDPIEDAMDVAISNLSVNLKTPATIMAILLIIFYGFKFIYGRVDAVGFITMICRIAVVTLLVTNAGNFNFYVKDVFFEHLPNGISKALVSKETIASKEATKGSAFDGIIIESNKKVTKLRKGTGWTDIGGQVACLIIAILVSLLCAVGFLIQSYAKLGLSIVISLGPVFICLYMWDSTKRFTEAWIAQAANFIILQVLVVAFLSILVDILRKYLTSPGLGDALAMLIPLLAIAFVSKIILLSLPFIASALAGGGASLAGMDSLATSGKEKAQNAAANTAAIGRAVKNWFGKKK